MRGEPEAGVHIYDKPALAVPGRVVRKIAQEWQVITCYLDAECNL
jgi:hypothetical protein